MSECKLRDYDWRGPLRELSGSQNSQPLHFRTWGTFGPLGSPTPYEVALDLADSHACVNAQTIASARNQNINMQSPPCGSSSRRELAAGIFRLTITCLLLVFLCFLFGPLFRSLLLLALPFSVFRHRELLINKNRCEIKSITTLPCLCFRNKNLKQNLLQK